jgi:hypothetical protein
MLILKLGRLRLRSRERAGPASAHQLSVRASPRRAIAVPPMEIVVTPETTYMMFELFSDPAAQRT